MKKTLLAALIAATALVPAAALAQDRGRWGGRDRSAEASTTDTSQVRQNRGEWRQRMQQQQEQSQRQPQQVQQAAPQAEPQRQWNGGGNWRQRQQDQTPQVQAQPQQQAPQAYRQQQWGGNRGQWNGNRSPDTQTQQRWGGNRGQWNGGNRTPDAGQYQQQQQVQQQRQQQWRGGDRNQYRDNRNWSDNRSRSWNGGNRGSWNNSWRNDSRYDWRSYRSSNRNAYRLPRYYAPSGWGYGYRRFGIGFTLNSILFSQRYWISDPWAYRLPEVDGPYRWVRYYNDALLVDIYSGEVVDTIYDIFW